MSSPCPPSSDDYNCNRSTNIVLECSLGNELKLYTIRCMCTCMPLSVHVCMCNYMYTTCMYVCVNVREIISGHQSKCQQ